MGSFAVRGGPLQQPLAAPGPVNFAATQAQAAPRPQAAPPLTLSAQPNPNLDALNERYTKYLNGLEGNSGQIMDQAGARFRDAREGGRKSLAAGQAMRGVASSNRNAQYEADTTRGVTGAIADVTNAREGMYGDAMRGGLGIAGAGANQSLQERQLQLGAYNSQVNAAQMQQQNQYNEWQALLAGYRSAPVYSGYGG